MRERGGGGSRIRDSLSPQIHGDRPVGLDWLDGPGIEFRRESVRTEKALRSALEGVDTVIHLALRPEPAGPCQRWYGRIP